MLPREIESYSYFFLKEEGLKLFLHALWLVESHAAEKRKEKKDFFSLYFLD